MFNPSKCSFQSEEGFLMEVGKVLRSFEIWEIIWEADSWNIQKKKIQLDKNQHLESMDEFNEECS